jgi:hypothetical protein
MLVARTQLIERRGDLQLDRPAILFLGHASLHWLELRAEM